MDNILTVENLTVKFKKHTALNGVSLSLEYGERVAIVGESGSGKSTLLRSVLRLIPAASGQITLFGKSTSSITDREMNVLRRRCGYIPQDPYGAIPPSLSVIEAVKEPEIICGVCSHVDSRELLAELGLSGDRILNSRAVSLSGGQRQRVEIARALALSPQLFLCDEPTSMQDASTRGEIIDVLEKRSDMAMIFVTHDLLLAARAAKKIIVLKNGRICETGTAEEVLKSPKHDYTKALIDVLPKIDVY